MCVRTIGTATHPARAALSQSGGPKAAALPASPMTTGGARRCPVGVTPQWGAAGGCEGGDGGDGGDGGSSGGDGGDGGGGGSSGGTGGSGGGGDDVCSSRRAAIGGSVGEGRSTALCVLVMLTDADSPSSAGDGTRRLCSSSTVSMATGASTSAGVRLHVAQALSTLQCITLQMMSKIRFRLHLMQTICIMHSVQIKNHLIRSGSIVPLRKVIPHLLYSLFWSLILY